MSMFGTIRFFSKDDELIQERRYHSKESRENIIHDFSLIDRQGCYYHILPQWHYKTKYTYADKPTPPIVRPVAIYDNHKSLYK